MPLAIRSEEVNHLAIKLAARAKIGKSEAVRRALAHGIARAPAVAEIRLVRAVPIQAVRGPAPSTAPGEGGFMKETSAGISSALA